MHETAHSFNRYSACPACGDLDGCHKWREAVPACEGDETPQYKQRFIEHREVERKHAARIVETLPPSVRSTYDLGALLFEILSGPETVAAEALYRLRYQNAELATVAGKCVIRLRANGKQFIIACAEDK
jgi:hypothetical protein